MILSVVAIQATLLAEPGAFFLSLSAGLPGITYRAGVQPAA
jgi:hypothetical protein